MAQPKHEPGPPMDLANMRQQGVSSLIAYSSLLLCLIAILPAKYVKAQQADQTPVSDCRSLPQSASIEVFSNSEAASVCREVLRIFEGVSANDIRTFEKAAYLFSHEGYETHNYAKITAEPVDIIRRRGLYNQQPRWLPTIDLVWKSFSAAS
jgi:hypothetical protein